LNDELKSTFISNKNGHQDSSFTYNNKVIVSKEIIYE